MHWCYRTITGVVAVAELDFLPVNLRVGTSPIALTFRPVMDVVSNTILYLDTFLMCNDEELGLLAPGMYFYAAENSERIETLNFIAIDLVAEALDRVAIDYALEPKFSLLLSSRFLESDDKFKELYAKLDSMELPHGRVILTFSAVTVLRVGHTANTYLKALRKRGFQIALTDFTVDTAEFSLLCDYHFDYLRIDADYVESAGNYARKNTAMQMLRDYAYKESVLLVANGVNTPATATAMRNNGIYAQSGAAIARGNSKIEQIYGVARLDDASDKYNAPIEQSEAKQYTNTRDNKGEVALGDEYADDYVRDVEYDDYADVADQQELDDLADMDSADTRYSASFTARLIQASPDVQMFYNAIKNTAHSYRDVVSRVGWSYDKIIVNNKTLLKLGIRGKKALVAYYALPVAEYADSDIPFEDVSGDKRHAKTPMRIKIRDELDLKKAMLMVTNLMERRAVPFSHLEEQDYRLPYESTEQLLARGLVRELQVAPVQQPATTNTAPVSREPQVKIMSTDATVSSSDDLNRLARDFAACLGHNEDDATEVVVCYMKKGGKK